MHRRFRRLLGPLAMTLALLALLPWLGAVAVACLPRSARALAAALSGAVALAAFALVLQSAPAVFGGEVLRASVEWLPALGLNLGLRLDGLAWLFTLLVTGIGALVVLYAAWYLDPADPAPRFYSFLLLFMGAMLGLVLADNLVLLVLFWELTSLSSFLLIGFWTQRDDAREGAQMALTVTGAGGLCLLAGVLLIGHIVGSSSLDAVLAAGDTIRASPLYLPALVLVLLGAFTKSAQFPFHFWLPQAMAAPTPVSAYLHSATMVKAGVFLLARLYPALGGSEPWFWIVSSVGLATLLVGAYAAIFQHDLKGLLAYSTIGHLGLIVLLFGLNEPLAVVAGVFHLINHACFKAGLFMSAGIVDHECGTRDMRRINGLARYMPFTAVLGIVAASAMAGVPLLNGFLSKEMFFAETVAKAGHGAMEGLLPLAATLAGLLSVAYSARFVHDVFFNGEPVHLPKVPHEAPFFMRLPVLLLVVLCLVVGIVPELTVAPLLAVAAQAALHGGPGAPLPAYTLALWHGFNLPLLMSAVAVVGGIALYAGLQRFVDLHRVVRLPGFLRVGGREIFLTLLDAGTEVARGLTAALQNGSLQRYLLLFVLTALAAGMWPFLHNAGSSEIAFPGLGGVEFSALAVWCVGVAAALAVAACRRQRLLALVLLGAVGLVVCLAFVHFSAPDLALTQLLVEVVSAILTMLALNWLPAEGAPEFGPGFRGRWRGWRDGLIATAVGLGIALLSWAVLTRPARSISQFFLDRSLPEGGGANAVNVIIVDFRGFDTLGEVVVLALAALVIQALLAGFGPRREPRPGSEAERHPLMLQLVSRMVLPFAVLIAIHLYLRGHNLPGGGFAGGLVLAIALILQFVGNGQGFVAARLAPDWGLFIGAGLLVATATGVGSWLFDAPFLTTSYDYPLWPLVGAVPLATAALFDAGVFGVVVGATMLALQSISRLTARRL